MGDKNGIHNEKIEVEIMIDNGVFNKEGVRKTMEKMLLDVILRNVYEKKLMPAGITFERKGKKFIAWMEAYSFDEIDFESIIESEVVYSWKERYNFLWEENKDTPQA